MSEKEIKKADKKAKKQAKKEDNREAKETFVRGTIGLVLLTVFGSIAFSTVVIWMGTDTWFPKIVTIPAAGFDLVLAFVAFSKILK